jgi:hypothetical protein
MTYKNLSSASPSLFLHVIATPATLFSKRDSDIPYVRALCLSILIDFQSLSLLLLYASSYKVDIAHDKLLTV